MKLLNSIVLLALGVTGPLVGQPLWVSIPIDEGFKFSVPLDWKKEKIRGLDSQVGKYRGPSAYLEFDEVFGLGYTKKRAQRSIDDMKAKEKNPKLLREGEAIWHLDGHIARFTHSKVDPKIFGVREYSNVASLQVPYEGIPGYLSVHLFFERETFLPTALQILQSFAWPKPYPKRR